VTRVLVVEDSETMSRLLQVVWECDGHQVRRVTEHFADLLDPRDPAWVDVDMLVTDLELGRDEPDGLDLLLVARDHHPLIRRGLLSGAVESDRYRQAQTVAHVVLPKPTHIDELRAVVA
jgi:DNA-binding response OmpR family regulator